VRPRARGKYTQRGRQKGEKKGKAWREGGRQGEKRKLGRGRHRAGKT
jgi:hypothetical protein